MSASMVTWRWPGRSKSFDGCEVDPAHLHVSEQEFVTARETVSP